MLVIRMRDCTSDPQTYVRLSVHFCFVGDKNLIAVTFIACCFASGVGGGQWFRVSVVAKDNVGLISFIGLGVFVGGILNIVS